MADDEEITSETVAYQAADWVSTLLSVPLIWPKATWFVATGITVLGISLIAYGSTSREFPSRYGSIAID